MRMKQCFKCRRTQPLSEFYRHAMMRDGHLNKCKDCAKRDVRMHRRTSERPREYDREGAKLPHRKAAARKVGERWAAKHPEAVKARVRLNNAVRDGKITRFPCEVCGEPKVHGHHRDYAKPLEVMWLCARHHHAAHGLTRKVPCQSEATMART